MCASSVRRIGRAQPKWLRISHYYYWAIVNLLLQMSWRLKEGLGVSVIANFSASTHGPTDSPARHPVENAVCDFKAATNDRVR